MNLESKIELFSRRLAQDPHSRVFAPLADLLRQAGRLDDALELLDDGLARHPEYISALVIKGRTLLEAGFGDQARTVLTSVMDLDVENVVVLRLLAEDACRRQAWTESIPLLEKLVVLDPDDGRWPSSLDEARRLAKKEAPVPLAPSEPTDSGFTTMTLVEIYLAQGYREKALAALGQMAAREPDREDILRRIAEIEGQSRPVPSGSAPPPFPGGIPTSSPEVSGNNYTARRNNEKKQFEDWITRLRQDGGSSS